MRAAKARLCRKAEALEIVAQAHTLLAAADAALPPGPAAVMQRARQALRAGEVPAEALAARGAERVEESDSTTFTEYQAEIFPAGSAPRRVGLLPPTPPLPPIIATR